jgi:glycerol-3-phosphate dehydrogenase
LIEQRDFAWGTSSRSSKMVHGGLRYLQQGRVLLTRASVQEREQLLSEGPGLIDPLGFLLTIYKGDFPGRWTFSMGLTVYDLLALQWDHEYYSAQDFAMLAPHISTEGLQGGFRFGDAQTDDARLVLRVIEEAVAEGGAALNYVCAEQLFWQEPDSKESRQVSGIQVQDLLTGQRVDLHARVVVNATGAWADRLRAQVDGKPRLRPLRGSHLLFPAWRLPVAQAISILHPLDRRPVFFLPWEGVTLVGTTDVDHPGSLDDEPGISPEEVAYLMAAVEAQFPSLGITLDDILSTYAGVRPVVGTGKANPSQESREHVVWEEEGLLTVTGGKMTTFRLIAQDTLKAIQHRLPEMKDIHADMPVLNPVSLEWLDRFRDQLPDETRRRLLGRYGGDAPALAACALPGELKPVPGARVLWAELRWAARAEGVVHLDDLLLRRVRLGLLLPRGGADLLPEIRRICQPELGWDDGRWEAEVQRYQELCHCCYYLPDRQSVPDWKAMLAGSRRERRLVRPARRRKTIRRTAAAGSLLALATVFLIGLWKRYRWSS